MIEFKEITPIANTAANVRAAANMLYDAAYAELQRRSLLASQETYELTVANCSQLLRPLQTIRVSYDDPDQGIGIDEELYILEATWSVTPNEVRTTRLVVSTEDRWPDSDVNAATERAVQGRVFQAHPQLGPNSYWENFTLYIGSDQDDHVAEMPFVLGPEVAGIDRARFRFKVTEPLSFISVVAGALDVSVSVSSLSVSVSGTINISHTHSVTISDHSHDVAILDTSTPGSPSMEPLYFDTTNDLFAIGVAGTDTFDFAGTTEDGGGDVVTSESGGSTTLSLSGVTGSGTGTGSVDLSEAIGVAYGVYRAPTARTYLISDLEYRINGGVAGAWIDLDTATDVGSDYYELDITSSIQDEDTFQPLQENNLIEIRRKSSVAAFTIDSSQGDGSTVGISTSPTHHTLSVGEQVIVTGTAHHDGVWLVVEVTNETVFRVNQSGDSSTDSGGSLFLNKAAMILAKLGIVSTIQAIAYT